MTLLFASSLFQDQQLQVLMDVLAKSFVILGITLILEKAIRHKLSGELRHLIILSGIVCVASLFLIPLVNAGIPQISQSINPIKLFVVVSGTESTMENQGIATASLVFFLYGLVAAALLIRLIISAMHVNKLKRNSQHVRGLEIRTRFNAAVSRLGIRREIQLRTCTDIQSPVSFGLIKPIVMIPENIDALPPIIQDEIFNHELSHVRRMDWLTLIVTRILSALLWANPLIWIATRRLHEEAEQACDAANLVSQEDRIRYAEDLLNLAKSQKSETSCSLLVQPMYDGGELSMRIKNILEGKLNRGFSRRLVISMLMSISVISVAATGIRLVAADSELDQEYLPLRTVVPMYPTRAADEGIEGWALVSFTVRADGLVNANSIQVIDAEPPGYFENNSRSAASRFEFEPRIVDGMAVDVPGVQYLFRYELEPGGVTDSGRPPPEAKDR